LSIEVRRIDADEFEAWDALITTTFGYDPRREDLEFFRNRNELDRAFAAYDGGEMVGTAGAISYQITLPGGATLPAAGITAVTVKSTHRRRGVLTAMMRAQHVDAAERNEPVAVLWASESAIYPRFGYGIATEAADLTIDRRHTAMEFPAGTSGRVRLLTLDEAKAVLPDLYERSTAGIPGTVLRSDPREWDAYFYDPEPWRDGASAARFAVFEWDGEPRGYVRYRQKPDWEDNHPNHRVRVGELHAVDAEAYAALFRYVFSIDLTTVVEIHNRRLDEPLSWMLAEPRRLRKRVYDQIWLKAFDVPEALAARRYAVDGSLVIEVVDDFDDSGGRFLLEGGPDGARCVPTGRDADLTLPVADLSAALLGRARFGQLAWVGRVAGDGEAVRRAQSMFAWPVEPWCTVHF
jgi:predicted acetyltransferase